MSERVSFPQVCGLSPLSSPNFTPEENNAGARGVRMSAWYRSEHRLRQSQHQSEFQTTADPLPTMSILTPFRCPAGSGLVYTVSSPHPDVKLLHGASGTGMDAGLKLGYLPRQSQEISWSTGLFQSASSALFEQTCTNSSQAKSRMLTAPLSVPLVFRSAKGTHPSLLRKDL